MGSGLLKSKKLETRIMGPGLVLLATEKKTLVEGHGRNMMVGHDGSSMLELVYGCVCVCGFLTVCVCVCVSMHALGL